MTQIQTWGGGGKRGAGWPVCALQGPLGERWVKIRQPETDKDNKLHQVIKSLSKDKIRLSIKKARPEEKREHDKAFHCCQHVLRCRALTLCSTTLLHLLPVICQQALGELLDWVQRSFSLSSSLYGPELWGHWSTNIPEHLSNIFIVHTDRAQIQKLGLLCHKCSLSVEEWLFYKVRTDNNLKH